MASASAAAATGGAATDDVTIAAVFVSLTEGRQVGVAVLAPRPRKSRADRKTRALTLYQFHDEDGYLWLHSLLNCLNVAHVYLSDAAPPGEMKRLKQL